MAYTRKVSRHDIRALPLSSLTSDKKPDASPELQVAQNTTLHHRPVQELFLILLCSLPLVIALLIASYMDKTHHWVIPFAQWLMKLKA